MDISSVLKDINLENANKSWEIILSMSIANIDLLEKNNIIGKIEERQEILFNIKPVLGTPRWFINHLYFLQEDHIGLIMEDGHVLHKSILKYDSISDDFYLVKEWIA